MEIVNSKKLRLEVYDINKNILGILTDKTEYTVENLRINEATNDTTKITFIASNRNEKSQYLINENLVNFNGEYYIVKKPSFDNVEEEFEVECEHESLRLKEVLCGKLSYIAETAESLITKVLAGTGWIFGGTDIPNTKKRHLETDELSIFANLVEIANSFNARLKFSTDIVGGKEVRSVSLYYNVVDNGRYIKNDRDLNSVNISYDSSEMATRLYVYGRTDDGTGNEINMMAAHPQKLPYVENFSYFKDLGYTDSNISSNKDLFIKESIIRESSLYTPQEVYDFAVEEIARLCYPKVEANISISDLACDDKYMKTPLEIGEVIGVIDSKTGILLTANITSISRDYENPLDVDISISNVIEKNSALKRMSQSSDIVKKIVGNGSDKIHGTYIKEATIGSAQIGKAVIENAHIGNGVIDSAKIDRASIQEAIITKGVIDSVHIKDGIIDSIHIKNSAINKAHIKDGIIDRAKIDKASIQEAIIEDGIITNAKIADASIDNAKIIDASITSAKIADASITNAKIVDASISNAKIINLDAKKINFGTATGEILDVQTLLSQFITGNSAHLLNLTGDNVVIANAVIKDIIAKNIKVEDLVAGNIDASKFNIVGENGNLTIKDNTIQIKDSNGTRVQIGKDASGDYSMYVWDSNGDLMFDSKGITDKAIKSKIIRDDMVSENANISGSKLNISSLITEINDDNTTTLKGSKINIDGENQTLDVVFNELKSNISYDVEIISTNGNIFKNGNIVTTLIAIVRRGKEDVTSTIDASKFRWTRISNDSEGDNAWNSKHFGGTKQVDITKDDVTVRATFNCEVLE